jgi:Spy/CpxP family protein refolding chaperone
MMKRRNWYAIAVAVVLCAGGFVPIKAQAAEPGARTQLMEKVKEKLGLTDEQVAKLNEQLQGEKEVLKQLISKLHDSKLELRSAIHLSDASESSIRAACAKVAAVEADLAVERHKVFAKINPILTSEQREKAKEFMGKIDDFIDGAINRLGERLGGS